MYQFYISNHFKKQLKPFLKKHKDLKEEIIRALKHFTKKSGRSFGAGTYKLRISPVSLNKGKSHGFRVIVLLLSSDDLLTPLTVYFKGDNISITKQEIMEHARIILDEI